MDVKEKQFQTDHDPRNPAYIAAAGPPGPHGPRLLADGVGAGQRSNGDVDSADGERAAAMPPVLA